MIPMALLTSIVRKEPMLGADTVVFAATQLLPVIRAATNSYLATLAPGQQCPTQLCGELLVCANLPPIDALLYDMHSTRQDMFVQC